MARRHAVMSSARSRVEHISSLLRLPMCLPSEDASSGDVTTWRRGDVTWPECPCMPEPASRDESRNARLGSSAVFLVAPR